MRGVKDTSGDLSPAVPGPRTAAPIRRAQPPRVSSRLLLQPIGGHRPDDVEASPPFKAAPLPIVNLPIAFEPQHRDAMVFAETRAKQSPDPLLFVRVPTPGGLHGVCGDIINQAAAKL